MPIRYNHWIAFLILSFAIIPTLSSFYMGLPSLDKQLSSSIPATIGGVTGNPTDRKSIKVQKKFGTNDWIERNYIYDDKYQIDLFVARGYDCRPFFHLPEYGILDRSWSERVYNLHTWKVNNSMIDVHILDLIGLNYNQKACYLLVYDGNAISKPFWFLIRNIPKMLLTKRKPYTLIFVSYGYHKENNTIEKYAKNLLISTFQHL